jgi:N-acetylneuraminic acid mutarotase
MSKFKKIISTISISLAFISIFCRHDNPQEVEVITNPENNDFSFKNGAWYSKASMNIPRKYPAGNACNGKIYVFGGIGPEKKVLNSVEAYDPSLDKWTLKNPMPVSLCQHSALSYNNKIYVPGGQTDTLDLFVNSLYEYNPELDSWSKKADMPFRRSAFAATLFKGKIYVLGGLGDNPEKVLEYSITDNKWTVKNSPMLTARHHLVCGISNSWIYTFNGIKNDKDICTNEVYNPQQDQWFIRESSTTYRHSSTSITIKNRIYIIGGYYDQGSYRLTEYYDMDTDTWSKRTPMITNRFGHIAVFLDSCIYVIGGASYLDSPPLAVNEMYEP